MTDDASPENLRKFLESDDPAMRRMGLSMAKGSGVPEELYKNVFGLSLWDPEAENRGAARELVEEIGLENITEFPGWLEPFEEEDVDRGGRKYAAEALWGIGKPAVELLIEALGDNAMMEDTHNGEDARGAIAWELGNIGDARAIEPLIKALFYGDGEYCVDLGRVDAAEALGKFGDARAVEPLIELWKVTGNDTYSNRWKATRDAIHRTLEKIGKPAVALLIQMLRDDEVQAVRPEWYGHHASDDYVNGDAEALIRCFAAEALGNIGDIQAVEPLIEALEDEKDTDEFRAVWGMGTRSSAAEALGKIGDARAVEPLIKALEDDNWQVRDAAKEALHELGHEVE